MKSIILSLIFTLFLVSTTTVFAFGDGFESATNIGQERTGDMMLTRCFYKTLGGYKFSIISRGICPFSVQVNPETGEVRK